MIIPARNEEKTILRNISSVFNSNYPKDKLEVILANNGSKDKTVKIIRDFKKLNNFKNLKIITENKPDKAVVLNKALKQGVKGEFVMCLDADSYLDKNSLKNAAFYFKDKRVMALSSNVKIIDNGKLLNLIQKFEYIICYQMKRAQTVFNIEYIIGGIGSTFRKSFLKKVGYYDVNTVTEDIDLTMKIIKDGNKQNRVIYGSDVIAYTESCVTVKDLLRQRFRLKYGIYQTFFKNIRMFFNMDKKYSKLLTIFYLPFAVFCDFAFLFEPVLITYILYVIIKFHDPLTFLSAYFLISFYISINIIAEDTIKNKDKISLLFFAPTMYLLFYILSFVEYVALIRGLINLKKIKKSVQSEICGWQHAQRFGMFSNSS